MRMLGLLAGTVVLAAGSLRAAGAGIGAGAAGRTAVTCCPSLTVASCLPEPTRSIASSRSLSSFASIALSCSVLFLPKSISLQPTLVSTAVFLLSVMPTRSYSLDTNSGETAWPASSLLTMPWSTEMRAACLDRSSRRSSLALRRLMASELTALVSRKGKKSRRAVRPLASRGLACW